MLRCCRHREKRNGMTVALSCSSLARRREVHHAAPPISWPELYNCGDARGLYYLSHSLTEEEEESNLLLHEEEEVSRIGLAWSPHPLLAL